MKKNSVPNLKEKIYSVALKRGTKGVSVRTLRKLLELPKDKKSRKLLNSVLQDLIQTKKVYRVGRKIFATQQVFKGKIQRFKEGFGFLLRDDGPDLFIPPHMMKGALSGDTVLVEIIGGKKRPEGRVIKIIERELKNYIGTMRNLRNLSFIEPDVLTLPPRLPIAKGKALPDHKIVFQITGHGKGLKGIIVEDLGHEDDPSVDIQVVLRKYNLPESFPHEVETYLSKTSLQTTIYNRLDLRNELIFTIDPRSAKDFDDAISIKKTKNGNFLLGIHIADVSFFVKENSPLDIEAFNRGTSVYLLDKVIPMLPDALSSDLCSLKPGKDRLTLSIFITLDSKGIPRHLKITESVIRSVARLTYEDAQRLLNNDDPTDDETIINVDIYSLRDSLQTAYSLYSLLRNHRLQRGGLDFDLPEPVFELQPSGEVLHIQPSLRLDTHKIIEEFMILANNQIATFLKKRNIPTIFRVHEPPKQEKLEEFIQIVTSLTGKHFLSNGEYTPKFIQSILKEFEGKQEEKLVNYLLLRSLAKAKYSVDPIGHYGLALHSYLHFTSPIRRYPDLVVHRIVKSVLRNKPRKSSNWLKKINKIAEQSTKSELTAQDAEFEIQDLKRMEFMKHKIGEIFDGIVTHVTPFGFFVEITQYLTEGFVPMEYLEQRYFYNRDQRILFSQIGKTFQVGQRVRVQILKVDKFRKRIELKPID